jgi:uncharacterized protein
MKTMIRRGAFLLIPALLSPATPARAATPSFDCNKPPGNRIEELICQDDELAELDVKLADVFAQAQKKAPRAQQNLLRAEQSGWVKGRNDCGKADDKRQCTLDSYQRRIAELQAIHRLVPPNGPHTWFCNNDPANEVTVTYFLTDPPTLVAKKGDQTSLMYLQPSGSGSKYVGRNETFWEHRNQALIAWGFNSPDMICERKP